jgi:cation:H+ antiporter
LLLDLAMIAVGVWILARAGDLLVDFAAALAEKARLTPAVVGLTVVAAGTSAPELFVSVTAALNDAPALAVGNVVGSNIANIALVLGAAAVIAPIPISRELLRLDYPFMLLASVALPLAAIGGVLGRGAGIAFVVAIVGFIAWSIHQARKKGIDVGAERVPDKVDELLARSSWQLGLGTVLAIVGLGVGARLLVAGASGAALALGVSERVVGLTVVAFGTSLPEFVATLSAAVKRQHAMAMANIIGSNIFNILLILGVTAILRPVPVGEEILWLDIPVMLGFALALLPVIARGRGLSRASGTALLVLYLVYLLALARG